MSSERVESSFAEAFLNEIVAGALAAGAFLGAAVVSAVRGIRGRAKPSHKRRPSPSVQGAEIDALHARCKVLEADVAKLKEEREQRVRLRDTLPESRR